MNTGFEYVDNPIIAIEYKECKCVSIPSIEDVKTNFNFITKHVA